MYSTACDPRTGHIARNFRDYAEQKLFEITSSNAANDWSVQSNANNTTGIETARQEYTGRVMMPFDKNRKKVVNHKN